MVRAGSVVMQGGSRVGGDSGAALERGDAASPVVRAVWRARAGDRDALAFLYARYADDLCCYVQGMLRDRRRAEQFTQRAFAKLESALGGYEERNMPFLAWMLRLARELVVEHIREAQTLASEQVSRSELGFVGLLDGAPVARWIQALRQAMATLPRDEHEVLVLRHFGGLSLGEIATLMGQTESSIRSLHLRGRDAVREQLIGRQPVEGAVAS